MYPVTPVYLVTLEKQEINLLLENIYMDMISKLRKRKMELETTCEAKSIKSTGITEPS